ncbi:MAG: zf-TFIIB domain-containing protein [Cereibacter sp.]
MLCPTDATPLVMTERSGVEIDYCPTCRGVWLDRGELDKIIDRALQQGTASPVPERTAPSATRAQQRHAYDDDDHNYSRRKARRDSFLGELFDF